jgi:hypothetical protein
MKKRTAIGVLATVLILLLLSMLWTKEAKTFRLRTVAAEHKLAATIKTHPMKQPLLGSLPSAGFHYGEWGRKPSEYYAVYRKPAGAFDCISDRYYTLTSRGSRRLIGLVFFDGDNVTTYTLSSDPYKILSP